MVHPLMGLGCRGWTIGDVGIKDREEEWWSSRVTKGKWEDGKTFGGNIEAIGKPSKKTILWRN